MKKKTKRKKKSALHHLLHEDGRRSLVKTMTFRVLIIAANSAIVYTFTGQYDVTIGVVAISSISSTLIYLVHERFWDRIGWGRGE